MKKLILSLIFICGLSMIYVSCGKKEIQNVRGQVVHVDVHSDSINGDLVRSMILCANGDTLLFQMADARYINGVMFKGDSVSVDYIEGKNDTLRALILNVLHGGSHIIELGKPVSDTLAVAAPEPEPMKEANDSAHNNSQPQK